jgi:hypothetical protein
MDQSSEHMRDLVAGGETNLRCTTQCKCPVFDYFRKAEIRYSEVSIAIEKQILGFEVSIYDVLSMKIIDGEDDAREIETRDICGKSSSSTQM